jgi:hypothetical protein
MITRLWAVMLVWWLVSIGIATLWAVIVPRNRVRSHDPRAALPSSSGQDLPAARPLPGPGASLRGVGVHAASDEVRWG